MKQAAETGVYPVLRSEGVEGAWAVGAKSLSVRPLRQKAEAIRMAHAHTFAERYGLSTEPIDSEQGHPADILPRFFQAAEIQQLQEHASNIALQRIPGRKKDGSFPPIDMTDPKKVLLSAISYLQSQDRLHSQAVQLADGDVRTSPLTQQALGYLTHGAYVSEIRKLAERVRDMQIREHAEAFADRGMLRRQRLEQNEFSPRVMRLTAELKGLDSYARSKQGTLQELLKEPFLAVSRARQHGYTPQDTTRLKAALGDFSIKQVIDNLMANHADTQAILDQLANVTHKKVLPSGERLGPALERYQRYENALYALPQEKLAISGADLNEMFEQLDAMYQKQGLTHGEVLALFQGREVQKEGSVKRSFSPKSSLREIVLLQKKRQQAFSLFQSYQVAPDSRYAYLAYLAAHSFVAADEQLFATQRGMSTRLAQVLDRKKDVALSEAHIADGQAAIASYVSRPQIAQIILADYSPETASVKHALLRDVVAIADTHKLTDYQLYSGWQKASTVHKVPQLVYLSRQVRKPGTKLPQEIFYHDHLAQVVDRYSHQMPRDALVRFLGLGIDNDGNYIVKNEEGRAAKLLTYAIRRELAKAELRELLANGDSKHNWYGVVREVLNNEVKFAQQEEAIHHECTHPYVGKISGPVGRRAITLATSLRIL